jgi:hypothetical protein
MPFSCRDLATTLPFSDAISHIPCRTPAMLDRAFRKATSQGYGRFAAWYVWISIGEWQGRGSDAAWERQGMCESALSWSLTLSLQNARSLKHKKIIRFIYGEKFCSIMQKQKRSQFLTPMSVCSLLVWRRSCVTFCRTAYLVRSPVYAHNGVVRSAIQQAEGVTDNKSLQR